MQRTALSICSRCRLSLFEPKYQAQWLLPPGPLVTRRFRSGKSGKAYAAKQSPARTGVRNAPHAPTRMGPPDSITKKQLKLSEDDPPGVISFFESQVDEWAMRRGLHDRLQNFGIPSDHIQPLLDYFVHSVMSGDLSGEYAYDNYGLRRFAHASEDEGALFNDIIYTSIFYAWASDPANEASLRSVVPFSTIENIRRLEAAAQRKYPAEEYKLARRMRRKVIMHVGPTNSGKTHHALRALAAAGKGVYAGPLRLLATEVWERLNLGQIVPLGMEPEPLQEIIPADATSHVPRKMGNPKYARPCNMITGEEVKIVGENVPLSSCTVEMMMFTCTYDVAVVDEIQMISDSQRGFAWTNAVLGLAAKELHLCGEETAVPVVEELLKETGDELVVRRYKRLTPLVVEETSLGELDRVRKGDCIVAFSRSRIFELKREIESVTGMRCAVVYGKLPSEIRSEQADLFNDPNSGYDVIIGSDAIGMGLNLKIRRIIFDEVKKFNNGSLQPLSVSQMKQIAGRAGRFGLHGDDTPGYATTRKTQDLPYLRQTLDAVVKPLTHARLGHTSDTYEAMSHVLPPDSPMEAVYNAHIYVSGVTAGYRYASLGQQEVMGMCQFIDTLAGSLNLRDRSLFMMSPIPWRDDVCVDFIVRMADKYSTTYHVDLMECLEHTDFLEVLPQIEERMNRKVTSRPKNTHLMALESFHKILTLYSWLNLRKPVAFSSDVRELKLRVEKALHWCLLATSTLQSASLPPIRRHGIAYRGRAQHEQLASPLPLTTHA